MENFGLQFEEMGTGRAHFENHETRPCPTCQGRGETGLDLLPEVTCTECDGAKVVPR